MTLLLSFNPLHPQEWVAWALAWAAWEVSPQLTALSAAVGLALVVAHSKPSHCHPCMLCWLHPCRSLRPHHPGTLFVTHLLLAPLIAGMDVSALAGMMGGMGG